MLKQLEDSGIEAVPAPAFASDAGNAKKLVRQVLSAGIDAVAYIIASGGTERMVLESAREIVLPIFLVASPSENSIAAACEVFPKLRSMGKCVRLIFNQKIGEAVIHKMGQIAEISQITRKLRQTRLGLVGGRSSWLVSDCTDFGLIRDKIGPQVVQVDLSELIEVVEKVPESRAKEISRGLLSNVSKVVEATERDVIQAVKIYLGVKNLAARYRLDALSIKCFDLIPTLNNTGCFAVSMMIDEGVIAGCEGDVSTTLTMLMLHYLTNKPVWMANTCSIDRTKNTLTFAHCTISTKFLGDVSRVALRSHFESGKGVSIQGRPEPRQKVTIARLGRPNADRMVVATGIISRSGMAREDMCRTQIEVKLDGKVETFLNNLLGNHVAVVEGDISSKLRDLCDHLGVSMVHV